MFCSDYRLAPISSFRCLLVSLKSGAVNILDLVLRLPQFSTCCVYVAMTLRILTFERLTFSLENSSKDEETLKTFKNVYSKLLRADKKAPLVSRVELYIDLLQQLAPAEETGST